MTPQDRLREILHADPWTPSGDGLARIQQRLARRRRLRLALVPATGLLAAAAIVVYVASGDAGSQKLIQDPATHRPTASTSPSPDVSAPPTTPVTDTYAGALWPFTSQRQADAWTADHGSRPWAADQTSVAAHFVTDYLGLSGVTADKACATCTKVLLTGSNGRTVGTVHLVGNGGNTRNGPPYSVGSVDGGDLTVTTPAAGGVVGSPLHVSGRVTGVDESILLHLISATGRDLASTSTPAGSALPWQASLTWTDRSWSTAGLVATTTSLKDGSVTRVAVVTVHRGSSAGSGFAGLSHGHVVLQSGATGALVRQLTFPPAGKVDTGLSWNGSSLVWTRGQQTGCGDELDRLDQGQVTTVVPSGTAHLGSPQLSPDGQVLAYLSSPCTGGSQTLQVTNGTVSRTITLNGQIVTLADVMADGTTLVDVRGSGNVRTLVVVGPAATSLTQGTQLHTTCTTLSGAFDGPTPVGWESCGDGVRVARFAADGSRAGAGPLLPTKAYAEDVSVRDGVVLAWLYDGSQLGRVVRVDGATLTVLAPNAGCSVVPEPAGCVRSPDW